MVCISAGLADNLNCLVHGKCLLIHQNTDQLRNYHRRMGIVNLNYRMLIHLTQIVLFFFHFFQNQLRRVAYHEILLVNTQKISRLVRVVGIQKESQILFDIFLIEVNSLFNQALVNSLNIKKSQLIDPVIITDDIYVIKSGRHLLFAKRYLKGGVSSGQPGLLLNPVILLCRLQFVLKLLLEQTEMVIQTNALAGKSKRCNGIQKACRQTAKTAVSKGRLRLHLLDGAKLLAVLFKNFT